MAAITVAGLTANAFAADTLADAFKNGKASGILKAWYFDRDTSVANKTVYAVADAGKGNASILNTGLVLGYVTDSFYGFKLGATMQSNFAPFATDDAKNLYSKDEYGSGAVLSEAYLAYTMKNTNVKVGRQFISTPLIAGSGTRMARESFEGARITNKDLPATTLSAIYVSKFQGRTTKVVDGYDTTTAAVMLGADSEIPEFSKVAVMKMGTGDYGTAVGTKAYKVGSNFSFDGIYAVALLINRLKI